MAIRWREVAINDFLTVPTFPRLTDYCDIWLIEPTRADSLRRAARHIDLAAHVRAEPEKLRSVTDMVPGPGGQQIAVISIQGLMMKGQSSLGGTSTVQVRKELRAAANDPEVGGIVLRVDSPGGTSAGTYDLAEDIRAAARKKPLMGQVEDLAASAAVWAMTWANAIYANNPKALYGSIGTYQVLYDTSAAYEANGERAILVATGPLKGMGVEGTKISDEQIAHVQMLVNSTQESFSAAVQKSRNLSAKEMAAVTHGGVITAESAIDAGLIDGVQSISKTIADMSTAIKAGKPVRSSRLAAEESETGGLPMRQLAGLPMVA